MTETLARDMYKEHILDIFRNPMNKGDLPSATNEHTGHNPLCGDEIKIQVIIKDNKVEDVKWDGRGCAISQVSASMLTDKIKGMSTQDIMKLKKEDMLEMLQIPLSTVRLKCGLLSLETVHGAIQ